MIHHDDCDTICAIATPIGSGGIAIIRLSGKHSLSLAQQIFDNQFFLENPQPRRAYFGNIHSVQNKSRILDNGILLYFESPHSFTGEDVIEFHIHGGYLHSKNILRHILEMPNIRLAQAGEFTKQAFLNGKMNLTQAEAVGDIISAESEAALIAARNQMTGDFHNKLYYLQERFIEAAAIFTTAIDFPDEDIIFPKKEEIENIIHDSEQYVTQLIQSYHHGKMIKEGVSIAIIGKPNVGKSSLFNALLKEDRAIVHETAGTTRDTISESFQTGGIRFILHDTAGIRKTEDVIESAGIAISKKKLSECHIIVWVIDGSKSFDSDDMLILSLIEKKNVFIVINKADLTPAFQNDSYSSLFKGDTLKVYHVSALTGQGIAEISQALLEFCSLDHLDQILSQTIITSERHYQSLLKTKEALSRTMNAFTQLAHPELIMVDLNEAIDHVSEITGHNISENILDRVFEKFCIGK